MKLDLIDVFGAAKFQGNPLGVVRGGAKLDDAAMLRLTQWLGFAETVFFLPPTHPDADYRIRIFFPAGELPFAGHPTLGACHAFLAAGGVPKREGIIMQECGIGLVPLKQADGRLAFKAPPLIEARELTNDELAKAAHYAGVDAGDVIEAYALKNGPCWHLLRLDSAAKVLAAKPEVHAPVGVEIGLAGPCDAESKADWEIRGFFANHRGILVEDIVTGSLNASTAQHLFKSGLAKGHYIANQGRMTGADGVIYCREDGDGNVWIGGKCATISSGGALFPA